jgi:hypothetical protein
MVTGYIHIHRYTTIYRPQKDIEITQEEEI